MLHQYKLWGGNKTRKHPEISLVPLCIHCANRSQRLNTTVIKKLASNSQGYLNLLISGHQTVGQWCLPDPKEHKGGGKKVMSTGFSARGWLEHSEANFFFKESLLQDMLYILQYCNYLENRAFNTG